MKNIRNILLVLFFFVVLCSTKTPFVQSTTFQDLTITPREITQGENVTILFTISKNQETVGFFQETVGFIIEHHPPAYHIIDDNTSQRYPQIAKSVSLPENQMITYKYVLSSNYTGVNVIEINHEGSPVLVESFTVNELEVVNMGKSEPSLWLSFWVGVLIIGVIIVGLFLKSTIID